MTKFIGRRRELSKLIDLTKKRSASLVVIRGRRRIGKSRLIAEFGASGSYHAFSGLPPGEGITKHMQLKVFSEQLAENFDVPSINFENWHQAFSYLAKLTANGRHIIALDEISWMGAREPKFLGYLKNAWDMHFSKNSELVLVLCGSVSSWIEKNILSHTGFVGRISLSMCLEEMPLDEAVQFWNATRSRTNPMEILKALAVTGGVPRYLEEIRPEISTDENIRRLCFSREGLLFNEFEQIFSDLFSSRAPHYTSIVKLLAGGSRTASEIGDELQRSSTRVSHYMHELIQAGFVSEDTTWNLNTMKESMLRKYRLSDNYVRFYIKYVAPAKGSIAQGAFEDVSLGALPNWNTVMGLQFENLVLNNIRSILPILGLKSSDIIRHGPFFQRATQRAKGCQIDVLIQSRYKTVFVCEVKFLHQPVGKEVGQQVLEKVERLVLPRGWSVRTVLIHVGGVTPDLVQHQAFDHIIDFCSFFN